MRRSSRSTKGTSSFRHSSSPAPQRSNSPVIGEESGEPIFFRARWCLSEKYSANKGEPDALGMGLPRGGTNEDAADDCSMFRGTTCCRPTDERGGVQPGT